MLGYIKNWVKEKIKYYLVKCAEIAIVFFILVLSHLPKSKDKTEYEIIFIRYPRTKNEPHGGDKRINDLLVEILSEKYKLLDLSIPHPSTFSKSDIVRYILSNIYIGLYVNLIFFTKYNINYKYVIIDSAINFKIGGKNTFSILHYFYLNYAEKVFKNAYDNYKTYINYHKYQISGLRLTKNIVFNEKLSKELSQYKIPSILIHSCVDTRIFKNMNYNKIYSYTYIGGYSLYGKGIDYIFGLADKGFIIDFFSNYDPKYKNIIYHEYQTQENVPTILNQSKIVFYPSRSETFGLVIVESLACGTPVICSAEGVGVYLKEYIPEFVIDINQPYEKVVSEMILRLKIIENNYMEYSQKSISFIFELKFDFDSFRERVNKVFV